MRAVVTGAGGMLGRAMVPALEREGWEVRGLRREDADVTDFEKLLAVFREASPDWVFHLAAFTRVNECETRPEHAHLINGVGAGNAARAAARVDAAVSMISTDYVFDGASERPYREDDPPRPLNVYGRSKLEGEQATRDASERFQIVRTSWLYGKGGRNFPDVILAEARAGRPLRVVNDQRGAPTWTEDLAPALARLAATGQYGVFHCTCSGDCTWFDFARHVIEREQLDVPLEPIRSDTLGPPRRPANSRLSNDRFARVTGHRLPPWQQSIDRYLETLGPSSRGRREHAEEA